MERGNQNHVDDALLALLERGALQEAATSILRALGPDVLRLIHARFRDPDVTSELFARFSEALWTALPTYARRCSVRVFVFTLARNVGNRYIARDLQRARAAIPLSQLEALSAATESIRTSTAPHLLTENKSKLARARAELDHDDQMLLTLRIDRLLEFDEIALIMLGSVDQDDAVVARESARLRKRLQIVKRRLKVLLNAP